MVNCQLPIINYQLSITPDATRCKHASRSQSIINRQYKTLAPAKSSIVNHKSSIKNDATRCKHASRSWSIINGQLSIKNRQSNTFAPAQSSIDNHKSSIKNLKPFPTFGLGSCLSRLYLNRLLPEIQSLHSHGVNDLIEMMIFQELLFLYRL